ncbi:hypothetical protein E4U55_007356 [Claviceps digitariae]|nr:hypothetical protein E4U55_007356 [Claviceps digitariae]
MADFRLAARALLAAVIVPAVGAVVVPSVPGNLPVGVVAVPMTRNAQQDAYYAEFQVGTPPQKELLKVDTGSPRYSFLNPRNPVCARDGQPCRTYGHDFQDDLMAVGRGDYLSDTLVLGGVTMKDMYFGYTSGYSFPSHMIGEIQTILGMSLECGAVGTTCAGKGPYFLPELKNASIINRMSASFYFGPDDADVPNAQMILGGAYDKAKLEGELFTVNMVDPYSSLANSQTNSVNVTALQVVLDGKQTTRETYGEKGVGVPVLLDSGVARWYLPQSIFDIVFHALGGSKEAAPGMAYQVIDCMYRDPNHATGYVAVEFGTAGTIKVPLHSLVTKFADGTCGSFIVPRDDVVSIFGDPFLRGTYIIYDQENWTVSMGQIKYTQEQNIVAFPQGGFKAKP